MDSTCVITPVGRLAVVTDDDGSVVAAGFCDVADLEARLHETTVPRRELGEVSRVVASYLAGDLTAIDHLACAQPGTAHQQRVWAALRDIPAGTTVTYGGLTRSLGLAVGASRAVGSACGANLIAPFVPCHRVVRSGGGLGGYYYGLPVKEWLLAHEGASATAVATLEDELSCAVDVTLAPPSTRSPATASGR